ncbi:DDE-type integrase/transposase/recombinase [Sedimenticola hydrogenitrophicus]|uniref:DDE-type integrase/transposase/recombinase n=1 Tax=Sedimenticola hydrogenitrophicus TaxID=2967975 RepID=UPI0021A315B2|nr:DDE-type integrase/transposase/recombinase [Sedimenticola hydrogenitrophicus]
MKLEDLKTINQLEEFISGTQSVAFTVIDDKDACYRWIQRELVKFRYPTLPRVSKGVVMRYLMKVSGYSRQQLTRLVAQYRRTGRLQRRQRTVSGFKRKYTEQDIRLLASMDERHDTPCGPALKKLCERACGVFGETQYTVLASISVSHLYNLRKSTAYTRQRRHFEKTRPKVSPIGERRKPQPDGQPGYIRIDTVHQGDLDRQKGVYHINAVDEVTQFEIVCSAEKISERYLIPALEQMLQAFPFQLLGFHSDNGSEYINRRVADLLEKLRIEFTKSRSRHSNDNALAESKNAAVVRKQFGYSHIPQRWAPLINDFNRLHLNPYLNFHRPCFFPETHTDAKGKQRKVYRYENLMTPYEKLKSLPNAKEYLKPGISFEILDKAALRISDNQAADQLQKARQILFKTIHGQALKTG